MKTKNDKLPAHMHLFFFKKEKKKMSDNLKTIFWPQIYQYFSYFSMRSTVVNTHLNHLMEAFLMITHNKHCIQAFLKKYW